MARHDLTGQTFNRLTVIAFAYRKEGRTFWLCECSCPTKTRLPVRANCLKNNNNNNTQSCGCQKIDAATRHGHNAIAANRKPSPTYVSWQRMHARCTNPHNDQYARYGALGITVCHRWQDFRNFLADMGERPTGLTLDRLDVDGNYAPTNCRWATPLQQAQNRRNNRLLTYEDCTQSVSAWAETLRIPRTVLQDRFRRGWTDTEILTTPYRAGQHHKPSRKGNI